jgi:hypothetical protein
MQYLRRKADAQLERWHEDVSRLPLLIKGARQLLHDSFSDMLYMSRERSLLICARTSLQIETPTSLSCEER